MPKFLFTTFKKKTSPKYTKQHIVDCSEGKTFCGSFDVIPKDINKEKVRVQDLCKTCLKKYNNLIDWV